MLLACLGMLLFPAYWEGTLQAGPKLGGQSAGPAITGRSTLTEQDLLPSWRGPRRRGDEDG